MERKMYKPDRQLPVEEMKALFEKGHHGTLSVNGDDGYPYAIPVNYVYMNDKIYIHSAKYGYKVEALEKDNKVCFSAILNSEIVQPACTAAFESVVAFGKVRFLEDGDEKLAALTAFVDRFTPDFKEKNMKFLEGAYAKTAVICIDVESITGKAYRMGASW